jgi:hypothetical protein
LATDDATEHAFARQRMAVELQELSRLAGIRDRRGKPTLREALPVGVAQSGGPMWVTAELTAAIDADPTFRAEEGPHRIVAEVVGAPRAYALRLSLERQGWLLRSPSPIRLRTAPWIPVIAAVVGVFALRWIRRLGAALGVAGLVAQLIVAMMAWPPAVAPRGLVDAWQAGPLASAIRRFSFSLPDEAFALGVGLVVLCTILVAFDHRRSRDRGGTLLGWGIVGVLGAVAWVEAAARVGAGAALPGPWGMAALLGLVAVYVVAWKRFVAPWRRA